MSNSTLSILPKAIFLMGPTASGKSKLAMLIAKHISVEIISVDSALIYKYMDIGTAKPSAKDLKLVTHHLINIRDPAQSYSVANFQNDAHKKMSEIIAKGRIPLLVGGSMLYFKALLNGLSELPKTNLEIRAKIESYAKKNGYQSLHIKLQKIDPIAANRIHPHDLQRLFRALEVFLISGNTLTKLTETSDQILKYKIYQFAIKPISKDALYQKIENRFHKMLDNGFEYEVKKLFMRNDLHKDMTSIRCVGYRQMWLYLNGEVDYNEMILRSIYATRHLAKHQMTWLRKWPNIHWLNSNESDSNQVTKLLKIIKS